MDIVKRNDGKFVWVVLLEKGNKKTLKKDIMYIAAKTRDGAIKAGRAYTQLKGKVRAYARLAHPVKDLGMKPISTP